MIEAELLKPVRLPRGLERRVELTHFLRWGGLGGREGRRAGVRQAAAPATCKSGRAERGRGSRETGARAAGGGPRLRPPKRGETRRLPRRRRRSRRPCAESAAAAAGAEAGRASAVQRRGTRRPEGRRMGRPERTEDRSARSRTAPRAWRAARRRLRSISQGCTRGTRAAEGRAGVRQWIAKLLKHGKGRVLPPVSGDRVDAHPNHFLVQTREHLVEGRNEAGSLCVVLTPSSFFMGLRKPLHCPLCNERQSRGCE